MGRMRRRTYYLALVPVTLALTALLPIYPLQGMDFPSFSRSRSEYRGVFLPATEAYGGGFDWTATAGNCIIDGGPKTHYEASPAVLVVHLGAALDFWIFLVALLSNTQSREGRRRILWTVSAVVIGIAAISLESTTLEFIGCPQDVSVPQTIAAGLATLSFAVGLSLLALGHRLADRMGPRMARSATRVHNQWPPAGGGA